ncbi:hypothetical protein HOY80DRAFT_944760 [Tuber brumale]|nr:hypothetical protein HOY80DRAFT_944760 [Tuber brumale]
MRGIGRVKGIFWLSRIWNIFLLELLEAAGLGGIVKWDRAGDWSLLVWFEYLCTTALGIFVCLHLFSCIFVFYCIIDIMVRARGSRAMASAFE